MEIETMALLTEPELRAGIRVFCEARDQYAEEGRPGVAGIYAAVLQALKGEEIRRKLMFKEHARELSSAVSLGWIDESKDCR